MSDSEEDFIEKQLKLVFIGEPNAGKVNASLMDLVAKHFGIPLSRIEREKQATIVKAELIPSSPGPVKDNSAPQTNSSVCCIQ